MEQDINSFECCKPNLNFTEIIADILGEEDFIRPSEYLKQISFTNSERKDQLLKYKPRRSIRSIHYDSKEHCFDIVPSIIMFQKFVPGEDYYNSLTIRNNAQTPRYLKTSTEENPYFSLEFRGYSYSMTIAPGLSHIYTVKFSPDENRDYVHQLKFVTDTGSFIIPVIAIGPRAILDFPDQIELPLTGVKISSSKSFLIRNIGNRTALFSIYGTNSRFCITPSKGKINEGDLLQFTIHFFSKQAGNFKGQMLLEYETGEKVQFEVKCSALNCRIRIDRNTLRIEETYIGLTKSKTVTIYNRSDFIVKFEWLLFEDENADREHKKKYETLYQTVYNSELPRCVDLVHYEACTSETHALAYQRIYKDELQALIEEKFRFSHKGFTLVPEAGEIWPQSSVEVLVHFNAYEFGEISSIAYLEASGVENRIPLTLLGFGKGPLLKLNVVMIDMQDIYLCSKHNYEVVVANKGHIKGTILYKAKPTDFGGIIKVNPEKLSIQPDQQKPFILFFSSNRKGDFIERIDFIIKESSEILSLHIKGTIVCPNLHFDIDSLVFEPTALGLSTKKEVCLHNFSSVPVTFSLTVEDDGDQPVLTYEEFIKFQSKPVFPSNPKEFTVSPEEGVVSASEFIKITVTYTANIARSASTMLRLDMWDSDSDPVTLRVTFCGRVAMILVQPMEIIVRFCFINFPYSRTIRIENLSDLDGYFVISPQIVSEYTPIVCSLSTYQGFLKPGQSKNINATIMTRMLGKQSAALNMLIMGERSPSECCIIECNGQGPVISAQPTSLDFGEVRVLHEKLMKFSVINDSPIPAHLKIALDKKDSPWSVYPNSGSLEPNGSMEIEVKLYLRDPGNYSDNITLVVVSSRAIGINLTAIGVGCSVRFQPDIFPVYDFGPLFSEQKINHPITVENYGTSHYQIIWTTEPEFRVQKGQIISTTDTKFQIQPFLLDLPPGSKKVVNCKLRNNTKLSVQEEWYIFSQILPVGKRELIGQSIFKVTLTEPQIVFNKSELNFRIDIHPTGETLQQTDDLEMINRSELPVKVQAWIKPPFFLINDENEHVEQINTVLNSLETIKVQIYFSSHIENGEDYSSEYSEMLHLNYNDNPNQGDTIPCKAVQNIPKLMLSSKNLVMDCELGSSVEEILTLANEGPVPVTFQLFWVKDSIEIHRYIETTQSNESTIEKCEWEEEENPFVDSCSEIEQDLEYQETDLGEEKMDLKEDIPNSKASDKVKRQIDARMKSFMEELTEDDADEPLTKIKKFLFPILKPCDLNQLDVQCRECMMQEPIQDAYLDKILDIVPSQGTLSQKSEAKIRINFHGPERISLSGRIVCKVKRGAREEVNIIARSDIRKFILNKYEINFGEQLFGEVKEETVLLKNECMLALTYHIEYAFIGFDLVVNYPEANPLIIEPNAGKLQPDMSTNVNLKYRSLIPGPVEIQVKLQVTESPPEIITIKAIGNFPQVYPCIPCENLNEITEVSYHAIQLLTTEIIASRSRIEPQICNIAKYTELSEEDTNQLTSEGWCIIADNETVPTIVDIFMSVDKLLTTKFVTKNFHTLSKWSTLNKNEPIPELVTLKYVIDMGHVIVGLTTHYSTNIINYGSGQADVRLRLPAKKTLTKLGIVVQFLCENNLQMRQSIPLHITWHAKPQNIVARSKNVKQMIYLEVIHGCTIPIAIRGILTYPYVSVNTKRLDFGETIIGECSMIPILVTNEGLVDCEWNVKLESIHKEPQEQAFRVNYDVYSCHPGESGIVYVYFQPTKPGSIEEKLSVIVNMGMEVQVVHLTGTAVQLKLNISKRKNKFLPTIPFSESQQFEFVIENTTNYCIEFFWQHLDNLAREEDKIAKILTEYYRMNGILLPRRTLGEPLPKKLIDFCKRLFTEVTGASSYDYSDEELFKEFIEKLKMNRNIRDKMGDPVSELFVDSETKLSTFDDEAVIDSSNTEGRICIIFYGAPFTDYEETACKVASKLNLPIACLSEAIAEAIASDDNSSCLKLRGIIDAAYEECLENFNKYKIQKEVPYMSDVNKSKSEKGEGSPKTLKSEKFKGIHTRDSIENGTKIHLIDRSTIHGVPAKKFPINMSEFIEPDPLEEFYKLFRTEEDLQHLDISSLYEYKIKAIVLLQKILSAQTVSARSKGKSVEKSGRKIEENAIFQINVELLTEILEERFSKEEFKKGFVIQNLHNAFVNDNSEASLLLILNLIHPGDKVIFISFMNSVLNCKKKFEELERLSTEENLQKYNRRIKEIDEMSLSEYELLPEEEKQTYINAVIPIKKQEALQRKMHFIQRINKLRKKKKEIDNNFSMLKTSKPSSKTKITQSPNQGKKSNSPRRSVIKKQESSKITQSGRSDAEKEVSSEPNEIQKITGEMEKFQFNLSKIETMLQTWDPMLRTMKTIPHEKTKGPQTAKSNKSVEMSEEQQENNFHTWYVNMSDPWSEQMYNLMISHISENPLITKILQRTESVRKPQLQSKIYSVLTTKGFSTQKLEDVNDSFCLSLTSSTANTEEPKGVQGKQNAGHNVENSRLRYYSQPHRREDEKSLNTSLASGDTNIYNPDSIGNLIQPRCILQPGEAQKFKIYYNPRRVGNHEETYFVTIANSFNMTKSITISGIADIPRLNMKPEAIFAKIRNKTEAEIEVPTYFYDTGVFNFGSILVGKREERVHQKGAELKFKNISKVPAKVEFVFMEENPNAFSFNPDKLNLAPQETGSLKLTATATKLGGNSQRLCILIKNNPKVEEIELFSHGTKLDLQLSETDISFNKILLYRQEVRILTICNKTSIPIYWNIKEDGATESQIKVQPRKGLIKSLSAEEIEFMFRATKVGMENRTMKFNASLSPGNEEIIFTKDITVSGLSYDVAVDINYANPIDFKPTIVNAPTSTTFSIRNRGDHNIKFIFRIVESKCLKKITGKVYSSLKQGIEISPESGILLPKNEESVQIRFIPRFEVTLKECPIIKCYLLDVYHENTTIAEIPLTVSICASYIKYSIHPFPILDFENVAIPRTKTMYLNIQNTGNFPLTYTIFNAQDKFVPEKEILKTDLIKNRAGAENSSKRDKKSLKSDKMSNNAIPGTIKIGCMRIEKTSGTIDVGASDQIAVICFPEVVGSQEERIIISVPDSGPDNNGGEMITLRANSCLPSIDFQDLDFMFQGNYLVDYIEDFQSLLKFGTQTIFTRKEKSLYFLRVRLLETHTASFRLNNKKPVPADVKLTIQSGSLSPKHADSKTFTVEPQNQTIPPLSCREFKISFTGSFIDIFTAVLEIAVELPPHLNNEKFIIKLVGESCLPAIAILEPPKGDSDNFFLNFGRSIINENNSKQIIFQNVGLIEAKVSVDISEDPNFVFTITAPLNNKHIPSSSNDDNNEIIDMYTVINLLPEEIVQLNVVMCPKEVEKCHGKLRLSVVGNPYENCIINLEGEGFAEFIVFEGLELVDESKKDNDKEKRVSRFRDGNYKYRRSSARTSRQDSASKPSTSLIYNLDYGGCFINKMYRKSFNIANKSKDKWFHFQFGAHPDIVFIPSMGYLKYLTSKEIITNFLAGEAKIHTNTRIECEICEINVANSMEGIAWDDRHTEVKWQYMEYNNSSLGLDVPELMMKTVELANQPNYDVLPETNRNISILLRGIVAYSEYFCDIENIHFEDTLMFQKREFKIVLSNPGQVNLDYIWRIDMDEHYPRRFAENSPRLNLKIPAAEKINSVSNIQSLQDASLPNQMYYEESPRASDLFSSSADLTDRTTDTKLESYDFPFKISPNQGTVLPQGSIECVLEFCPKDVFHYKANLSCQMENLKSGLPELVIPITARSLLPYCHFDIGKSDYISSRRRSLARTRPVGYDVEDPSLWEDLRVIEFKVIAIGETHFQKFHIINPTLESYRFFWKDVTYYSGDGIPNFHCTTPEGIADRGKRSEIVFAFVAEDVGVFESFWLFSIENYNLKSLFLLVATVAEPSVYCSTLHLKLQPVTLGDSANDTIKIINQEDVQIPFKISLQNLCSHAKPQDFVVSPMKGNLMSKQEQIIRIVYQPTAVGEFTFAIHCHVKWMKKPLTICVTTSVYNTVLSVVYTKETGETREAQQNENNIVDFGKVIPGQVNAVTFIIRNLGEMPLHYKWDTNIKPDTANKQICIMEITEIEAEVVQGSNAVCNLQFKMLDKKVIKDQIILLKISKGPTYRFLLKASAREPSFKFNFTQFDFGPCYIQDNNFPGYKTELSITNSENKSFIVDCNFEEKPYMAVLLESLSNRVAPHSSTTIPILFRPTKEAKYTESLLFTINGTTQKKVIITGEGITYKIHLVNPRDKLVHLGSILVNKTITKRVPIINDGSQPVTLQFGLISILSNYQKTQECKTSSIDEEIEVLNKKKDSLEDFRGELDFDLSKVLVIEPSKEFLLRPGQKSNVIIKFCPNQRMKSFSEKVAAQTSNTMLPLFILQGSCIGPEFKLSKTQICFGTVLQLCTAEAKLLLMNTGDVGARFKWNTTAFPNDLSINPASGYCSPGMNIDFTLKFQPTKEYSFLNINTSLDIEKYATLSLNITGTSCKLPEPNETIFFESNVRGKEIKSVNVTNDTNMNWELVPEVIGDYFKCDDVLLVPAGTTRSCLATYSPLTMNSDDIPHKGRLMLKIPGRGNPILYSLQGKALPPQVLDRIFREFPAKTKYTELLTVYNWLNTQEKLSCNIELENHIKQKDIPLFYFSGSETIDVPANSQRDYRATFHSYEEFDFHFKVTFTNQEKEYQFYEIYYKVSSPEILDSIRLNTTVRNAVCHSLKLQNPLEDKEIVYTAQCSHPSITISEIPKSIAPLSSDYINIKYDPLLECEELIVKCNIFCQELGRFPYELRLRAIAAPPEKATRITVALGGAFKFTLPIRNHSEKNTDFTITVDNDCFTSEKHFMVQKRKQYNLEVTYEPCNIGTDQATLIATSNVAGEFIFPIIGNCGLPKPAGPFTINKEGTTTINFKNVFKQTKTFHLILHPSDCFSLEHPTATINSKQSIPIKIKLLDIKHDPEKSTTNEFFVAGKLTVYCTDADLCHINWIYYLRGVKKNLMISQ